MNEDELIMKYLTQIQIVKEQSWYVPFSTAQSWKSQSKQKMKKFEREMRGW